MGIGYRFLQKYRSGAKLYVSHRFYFSKGPWDQYLALLPWAWVLRIKARMSSLAVFRSSFLRYIMCPERYPLNSKRSFMRPLGSTWDMVYLAAKYVQAPS